MITAANAQEQKNAPKIIIIVPNSVYWWSGFHMKNMQDEKSWIIIITIYKQYQLKSKEENPENKK